MGSALAIWMARRSTGAYQRPPRGSSRRSAPPACWPSWSRSSASTPRPPSRRARRAPGPRHGRPDVRRRRPGRDGQGAAAGLGVRLLSVPLAVVVGDWSYSLYLWHWPVLRDRRGLPRRGPAAARPAGAGLARIFGLSALTYRLVEEPFRRGTAVVAPVARGGAVPAQPGRGAGRRRHRTGLDRPRARAQRRQPGDHHRRLRAPGSSATTRTSRWSRPRRWRPSRASRSPATSTPGCSVCARTPRRWATATTAPASASCVRTVTSTPTA